MKENLRQTFNDINIYIDDPFEEDYSSTEQQAAERTIYAVLNANFIISMTAAIISLSFFAFMVLAERGREIGLFKALGMVKNQLFLVFVSETLVILSIGIVTGNTLGYIVSKMFISYMTVHDPIPPFIFYIPYNKILVINLVMLIGALLAAAIPAWIVSRVEAGRILRSE